MGTFRSAWGRCRDDIVVSGPGGYGTVGIFRWDYRRAVDLGVGPSGNSGTVYVIASDSGPGVLP